MPELPHEIWKDRVTNELKSLENLEIIENSNFIWQEDNVDLKIELKASGFRLGKYEDGRDLEAQKNHRISLKINRSFPYPGSIDFSWHSNLFHPNIHPIEQSFTTGLGTGYICLNILKQWSKLSDLETTVKALQRLVENPNPDDPLNYPICLHAAEFYNRNDIDKLRERYYHERPEEEKEQDDDDDIIILD